MKSHRVTKNFKEIKLEGVKETELKKKHRIKKRFPETITHKISEPNSSFQDK